MTAPPASDAAVVRPSWVTADVKRILLAQVVFGFGWSLYLLLPKFLATQLQAPPDAIGRISAMGGVAGLLTLPFTALWLDRFERRRFFRAGALCIIAASIGLSQVHAIGPLVYVMQGCVSASFVLAFNATAAMLSDYAPPERLGQAIGWLGSANVGMNAVATMIAEPVASHFGWSSVFGLGLIAGCAAFAFSFWLKPAAAGGEVLAAAAPRPAPAADSSKISRAAIASILLTTTLMGAVFIGLYGFVQPYAVSLGAKEVRWFFVGYTVSVVAGRVFLGQLGDRAGRRNVSMWMLVGYAVAAALMVRFEIDLLAVYGLVFGAAHGLVYPTLNALLIEFLPVRRRGLAMVLYNGGFNLGSSVGAFGWGLLAKYSGYSAVYEVSAVCALMAAAILFATRSDEVRATKYR